MRRGRTAEGETQAVRRGYLNGGVPREPHGSHIHRSSARHDLIRIRRPTSPPILTSAIGANTQHP